MYFSVLIPIYNAEKYLVDCIESVRMQTFTDFEIILINDGSTDNSSIICDEFAYKDSRISVFHKPNEGQLLARSFAIRQSKGRFLLFLDADDMWEKEVLQMVFDTIYEHDADMVLFRYKKVDMNGLFLSENDELYPDRTVFTKVNKDEIFIEIASGFRLNNIWTKAVSREIVDASSDYSKHRIMMAEDLLQSLPLFKNAEKIVYRNKALYIYRQHNNSITSKFDPSYIQDVDYVRHIVYDYLCELKYNTPSITYAFFSYYLKQIIIANVFKLMLSNVPYSEKKRFLNLMRSYDFYKRAITMGCHKNLPFRSAIVHFIFRNRLDRILLYGVIALSFFRQKFPKIRKR